MFSPSVCLCSGQSLPRRGACCRGAAYFGLTQEASSWGREASNTALFVLWEGAFVSVVWEQAKSCFSAAAIMFPFSGAGASQCLPRAIPSRNPPFPGICRAAGHPHAAYVLLRRTLGSVTPRRHLKNAMSQLHTIALALQDRRAACSVQVPHAKGQSWQLTSQDGGGLNFPSIKAPRPALCTEPYVCLCAHNRCPQGQGVLPAPAIAGIALKPQAWELEVLNEMLFSQKHRVKLGHIREKAQRAVCLSCFLEKCHGHCGREMPSPMGTGRTWLCSC